MPLRVEKTDKISYGGVASSDITYTASFHNLVNGVQTHCRAPLGVDIRERWTVNGSLPGEPLQPVELGIGAPAMGLYLREDVDLRCNVIMSGFVKKTLKKSHATLVDRLTTRAQLSSPSQRGRMLASKMSTRSAAQYPQHHQRPSSQSSYHPPQQHPYPQQQQHHHHQPGYSPSPPPPAGLGIHVAAAPAYQPLRHVSPEPRAYRAQLVSNGDGPYPHPYPDPLRLSSASFAPSLTSNASTRSTAPSLQPMQPPSAWHGLPSQQMRPASSSSSAAADYPALNPYTDGDGRDAAPVGWKPQAEPPVFAELSAGNELPHQPPHAHTATHSGMRASLNGPFIAELE